MNNTQETELVERWHLQSLEDAPMPIEDLEEIVMNGFYKCEGLGCLSAHVSGEDSCRCIRSVFPHPYYYQMYQELRDKKLKAEYLLDIMLIGAEVDTERNNT